MIKTNFDDVVEFHTQFGLPTGGRPQLLTDELFGFRIKFLHEELAEFSAAHNRGDLAEAADGLVDLVYVVLGTATMMGLPWQALWDEVHRANMKKIRVASSDESKRGSAFDVRKPASWVPPDLRKHLA